MIVERVINSIFTSNTYLLHEDGGLDYWLVDIGDIDPVQALLPEGAKVQGLLLTHTHYDHMYGINRLVSLFPDCLVYTSEHGREGLYSDKLNNSRYHYDKLVYSREDNVRVLCEGDLVPLWPGCDAEVYETPGHDWSCLVYRVGSSVFSGDSFLPGIKVTALFPKSDKTKAVASEQRIRALSSGRMVYPGHGESSMID